MTRTLTDAYYAAMDADRTWANELRTRYGRQAGDARYDARGVADVTLRRLAAAKRHADAIYLAACAQLRADRGESPIA